MPRRPSRVQASPVPEEVGHDVSCSVAVSTGADEPREEREVLSDGHERGFYGSVAAALAEADSRDQPVAQAAPPDGVLHLPALAHVGGERLGWAAVPDLTAWFAVRDPQIAASQTRWRWAYTSVAATVPGRSATLKGKPVGDARGSVRTCRVPESARSMRARFNEAWKPDSSHKANAEPTWTPAAPTLRASLSSSGLGVGASKPVGQAERPPSSPDRPRHEVRRPAVPPRPR